MVVVLEGVLVDIDEVIGKGRFGRTKVQGYNWSWLEVPLKNMVSVKRRFPDTSVDVVTFLSEEAADNAANFFSRYDIAVNDVYYADFKEWCWALSLKPEIVVVYDSDTERLHHYGQRGYAVVKGRPW